MYPSSPIKIILAAFLFSGHLQAEDQKTFYEPVVKRLEGWTVKLDPQLLQKENKVVYNKAIKALANHLQRITYIVPAKRLKDLKKVLIWMELDNPELGNMQYHPNVNWLINHGHDPRLVKHVHITHAEILYKAKTWEKHPYVILHELAHGFHDQVLSFDNPEIIKAYKAAMEKGIYEEVLSFTGKKVPHYSLTNHKEYFAESTEAYFGVNDFYPFVRAELEEHDPVMHALLKRIWSGEG